MNFNTNFILIILGNMQNKVYNNYLKLILVGYLLVQFSVVNCARSRSRNSSKPKKVSLIQKSLNNEHLQQEPSPNRTYHHFKHPSYQQKEKDVILSEDIPSFLRVVSKLLKNLKEEVKHNPVKKEKCGNIRVKTIERGDQIVVFNPQDHGGDITLTSLLYKEADAWSSCRRSCRTSRIRKCRFQFLCSVDVLVEEAYCFTPGSKCEKKVTKLIEEVETDDRIKVEANDEEERVAEEGEEKKEAEQEEEYDYYNNVGEEKEVGISYTPDGVLVDANEAPTDYYYFFNTDEMLHDYEELLFNDYDSYSEDYPEEEIKEEKREEEATGKKRKNKKKTSSKDKKGQPGTTAKEECGKSQVAIPYKMFRIIGGSEAMKGSWPWQVAILNRFKEVFCGGTIIAPRWVLTAAHCVKKKLYVRIGEHNLAFNDGEFELKVQSSFKHPDFDLETVDNDIALLELPTDILHEGSKHIHRACLPPEEEPLPKEQSCVVLGWGKESESHIFGSDVLRYAKVPIVGNKACKKSYDEYEITSNMFCAGYLSGGVDACAGDSGGPLLCKNDHDQWVLHGVTSFGDGCGDKGRLGVYTKVSNFLTWINETISENSE